MSNDWFEFKRFTVRQSGAAMKIGTDGVLLGAWARFAPRQRRILDVGTGTGLIALMAAQRTETWNADIDAIDIDTGSTEQAAANFSASPWTERLHAIHAGLREFTHRIPTGGYDHIVSNPPYFADSLTSPDKGRTTARHTASLTHEELIACAARLLAEDGLFSVVLPYACDKGFCAAAAIYGFAASRKLAIHTTPAALPKRILIEFRKMTSDECAAMPPRPAATAVLTVSAGNNGDYTEEYKSLTKDFYLAF